MKNLFDDNRLANILTIMRKSTVLSIASLAARLGVSERTIRNDIKSINDALDDSAYIETDQGKCSLRIFDLNAFQYAYSKIINTDDLMNSSTRRMEYIFGKLMRAYEPLLTDDLAYEMNVGRTTLVSDLKKLRSLIEPYDLHVEGKTSKGMLLRGSEMNIRRYVMDNTFEAIYGDYPQDEQIIKSVDKAFEQYPVVSSVRTTFQNYLTLMMDRFLTGHYIGRLPDSYYVLSARSAFRFVDRLLNDIGNSLHVEFPIEEKLFVLLPIIGMRTPTDTDQMYAVSLDEEIRPLLEKIIQKIEFELNITINTHEFTEEFMYHLMFMINRLRYNIRVDNPLVEDIKEKYPLAQRMAEISAEVIEQEMNLKVTPEEIGFLASYFGVFLEVSGMQRKQRRMAVVCGTGIVTSRLITVQLKKIVDSATDIQVFSLTGAKPEKLNTYDIVLSTVELPFELEKPVIYIREIFNEEELRSRIEKADYWSKEKAPFIDDNWYVMASQVKEETFFDLSDYTDYEEAVNTMIECLTDEELVDAAFQERLWEREKMGSMVFDRGIAMPHTMQYANEELMVAIGVFNQPILYKDAPVKVIFMLGLPKDVITQEDLLIRIYDEIMTISKDDELIDGLSRCQTYPELLRILYKRK